MLILASGIGPRAAPAPRFDPAYVLEVWRNPAIRLANLGYLGHMWELYAMWAWIGAFLSASFAAALPGTDTTFAARLATFATVGVGALGCFAGGWAADRIGRTTLAMLAMAVSGTVAATVGFLFGADPWLVTALCVMWGIAVIANSAQFSASVAELAVPERVGTMLAVQTCLGFTLTLATIQLMPYAVGVLGCAMPSRYWRSARSWASSPWGACARGPRPLGSRADAADYFVSGNTSRHGHTVEDANSPALA